MLTICYISGCSLRKCCTGRRYYESFQTYIIDPYGLRYKEGAGLFVRAFIGDLLGYYAGSPLPLGGGRGGARRGALSANGFVPTNRFGLEIDMALIDVRSTTYIFPHRAEGSEK